MTSALIGYSGFVGSVLLRQRPFEGLYRSSNIGEIDGREFDLTVCCAAPAQKWIANREPEADLKKIEALMARLDSIRCGTFVLISTVDVFKTPVEVDEDSTVEETGLHAYGLNRRLLEKFVEGRFARHLIVRLPGLVGPGLRKNVLFDFLNGNNLQAIESRSVFQFYPMVNLWYDIQTALDSGLRLVHLTAEPISVAEASEQGFGRPFHQTLAAPPARYDLRSKHAAAFGAKGNAPHYQYSKREALGAIRAYAQSEPVSVKNTAAAG